MAQLLQYQSALMYLTVGGHHSGMVPNVSTLSLNPSSSLSSQSSDFISQTSSAQTKQNFINQTSSAQNNLLNTSNCSVCHGNQQCMVPPSSTNSFLASLNSSTNKPSAVETTSPMKNLASLLKNSANGSVKRRKNINNNTALGNSPMKCSRNGSAKRRNNNYLTALGNSPMKRNGSAKRRIVNNITARSTNDSLIKAASAALPESSTTASVAGGSVRSTASSTISRRTTATLVKQRTINLPTVQTMNG